MDEIARERTTRVTLYFLHIHSEQLHVEIFCSAKTKQESHDEQKKNTLSIQSVCDDIVEKEQQK